MEGAPRVTWRHWAEARRLAREHARPDERRLARIARCGVGGAPQLVLHGATGRPGVRDSWGCEAPDCPRCSRRLLGKAADQEERAARVWTGEGGSLALLTLTIAHRREDSADASGLRRLLRGLLAAWRRAVARLRGTAWSRVRWTRVLEASFGAAAGWHPHFHVAVYLPTEAAASVFPLLCAWRAVWPEAVADSLGESSRPLPTIGVDLRVWQPNGGQSVGGYTWGLAGEVLGGGGGLKTEVWTAEGQCRATPAGCLVAGMPGRWLDWCRARDRLRGVATARGWARERAALAARYVDPAEPTAETVPLAELAPSTWAALADDGRALEDVMVRARQGPTELLDWWRRHRPERLWAHVRPLTTWGGLVELTPLQHSLTLSLLRRTVSGTFDPWGADHDHPKADAIRQAAPHCYARGRGYRVAAVAAASAGGVSG